jgi:hypothetical protein
MAEQKELSMELSHSTQFERLIRRLLALPFWLKILLAIVFLGLPLVIAYLEGLPINPFGGEISRSVFFPSREVLFPAVGILYIIAVAPWIWRAEQEVAESLRPLVHAELNAYNALAQRVWWRSSRGDWIAFGAGILGELLLLTSSPIPDLPYWADIYLVVENLFMYGALVWLIYAAMGSARLTALRHRYILHTDSFDLTAFEPVGRQALVLSLIFVGAITLSLLFVDTRDIFFSWESIVIYSILILVTISIFFVAMWPTHRTLQRVKFQKLTEVQRAIGMAFQMLQTSAAGSADTHMAATELQAWITLERRLKQTRTWPYDTEMLRILFISVLTPLFLAISRAITTLITEGHLKLW